MAFSVGAELMNASWPTLVCPSVGVHRRMSLTSPEISGMSYSSLLDSLCDERYVAIQLLCCRVLLPVLVKNSMQHPCVVRI